jgi:hypothetical protein
VLLKGDPSADTTPFDFFTDRYLSYPVADPAGALEARLKTLLDSLRSSRGTDSPISLKLPTLAEAGPSEVTLVTLVTLDFIEDVERAEAAADKGWLRVIAEELRGQRFQRDGLWHATCAPWSLEDLAGARSAVQTAHLRSLFLEGDERKNERTNAGALQENLDVTSRGRNRQKPNSEPSNWGSKARSLEPMSTWAA